jgi:hypothetical protein
MYSDLIVAVTTAVLSVVAVFFGAKYRKWLEQGILFAKLFDDIVSAAEDAKVSEEEFQRIVAEAKKVAAQMEE